MSNKPSQTHPVMHVAVGVVTDSSGNILLTRRLSSVHLGGFWEFPGGKVNRGESVENALGRELAEELGVVVHAARPLIRIPYQYADRRVLLDVWRISDFEGTPRGREGQPIEWVAPGKLGQYTMPPANRPIIRAITLPEIYLITPEPGVDRAGFLTHMSNLLMSGIRLVQLRAKTLNQNEYQRLAGDTILLAQDAGANVLLNAGEDLVRKTGAFGMHLTGERLMKSTTRPLSVEYCIAASCHNEHEVRHAIRIGVDFITISPVLLTASHPGAEPLGWEGFHQLTELAAMPAYALGGVAPRDLSRVNQQGGQGVAAISSLWNGDHLQEL